MLSMGFLTDNCGGINVRSGWVELHKDNAFSSARPFYDNRIFHCFSVRQETLCFTICIYVCKNCHTNANRLFHQQVGVRNKLSRFLCHHLRHTQFHSAIIASRRKKFALNSQLLNLYDWSCFFSMVPGVQSMHCTREKNC